MIDSHVHFWNYHPVKDAWITDDMKRIQTNFTPADLEKELKLNGVNGCIAVQADQSEQETEFLLNYAYDYPFIKGVVGWIDLRSSDLPERLAAFAHHEQLVGWRHIAQPEPEGFLISPAFVRGIAALKDYQHSYDLVIHRGQLKEAIQLVAQFPQQRFVLDHLAKPDIRNKQGDEEWRKDIVTLSKHPNVYGKISGMVTEADWNSWTYDDMIFYLDVMFENFGTNRLMFGSDWPVCILAASYRQTKQILDQYTGQFTDDEKNAVFELNAVTCYQLKY